MEVQQQITEFKICLIGGPKTGKTTFLTEMLTGRVPSQYQPTAGLDVGQLMINTNYGVYKLVFWDTGGLHTGLGACYYINSHASFAFYGPDQWDLTEEFVTEYERVDNEGPIINIFTGPARSHFMEKVCRRIKRRTIYSYHPNKRGYVAPILHLLKTLTNHADLVIV